ncbi:hypothetical protein RCL1_000908 [Eukaryota sp. TZLM3-RCL]
MRDDLRLKIDGGLNYFSPQIDPTLYHIDFVLICDEDSDCEIIPDLFVVEVFVKKGPAPIYFTSRYSAFIRTAAGITKMSQSLIESRLRFASKDGGTVYGKRSQFEGNQLFNPPPDLIGRQEEINQLVGFMSNEGHRVVVIYGAPLVGKSAVGRVLVSLLSGDASLEEDQYLSTTIETSQRSLKPLQSVPRVHLALDLSGISSRHLSTKDAMRLAIKSQISYLAENFSESFKGSDLKAKYQSLFAGKHVFLLLENAGNVGTVYDLLPSSDLCAKCSVIITSRKNLGLESVVDVNRYSVLSFKLSPLSPYDGALMLKSLVPAIKHADGEAISSLLGGLPQALRITAGLFQRRKIITSDILSARITTPPDSPAGLHEPLASLYLLLAPALAQLSVESKTIIEIASVFPRSFTFESLSTIISYLSDLPGSDSFTSRVALLKQNSTLMLENLSILIEDSLLSFDSSSCRYFLLDAIKACLWHLAGMDVRDMLREAFVKCFVGFLKRRVSRLNLDKSSEDSKNFLVLQSLIFNESSNFESMIKILSDNPELEGREEVVKAKSLFESVLSEDLMSIVNSFQ